MITKKRIFKIGKWIGIICLVLFAITFVWANWHPLSPGEKANPVSFIQFDTKSISDESLVSNIQTSLKTSEGVTATAYNSTSQILSVGFEINKIDQAELIQDVKSDFNVSLNQLVCTSNGPKCPMTASLNFFKSVRQVLNVRK